jgi:hypothetical protein
MFLLQLGSHTTVLHPLAQVALAGSDKIQAADQQLSRMEL